MRAPNWEGHALPLLELSSRGGVVIAPLKQGAMCPALQHHWVGSVPLS